MILLSLTDWLADRSEINISVISNWNHSRNQCWLFLTWRIIESVLKSSQLKFCSTFVYSFTTTSRMFDISILPMISGFYYIRSITQPNSNTTQSQNCNYRTSAASWWWSLHHSKSHSTPSPTSFKWINKINFIWTIFLLISFFNLL